MPPPAPHDSDSESESDSIWLRRLTFRDRTIKIRVQEEWGAGIGEKNAPVPPHHA